MKPGRNDPCSCGSGKKYKKCCLPTDAQTALAVWDAREQARATGFTTSVPLDTPVPSLEQVESWPVRKVWVPVPEIFAVTGYGVCGVLRENGPQSFVCAQFILRLADGGLYGMSHKDVARPEVADEFVAKTAEQLGASEPGEVKLASRLLWACHDHLLEIGDRLPAQSRVTLALLPRTTAGPLSLDDISGVLQSVPSALVAMVRAHRTMMFAEHSEIAVLTEAQFFVNDPTAVIETLRSMRPDFDDRDNGSFDFTRLSLPGHTAPLSRIPGRRIQGELVVDGNVLLVGSGLSMMAKLLALLFSKLRERPTLLGVRWFSPTLKKAWQWDAREEPLAFH